MINNVHMGNEQLQFRVPHDLVAVNIRRRIAASQGVSVLDELLVLVGVASCFLLLDTPRAIRISEEMNKFFVGNFLSV